MNQKYCLVSMAYREPVYVSFGYQWTDCINKAKTWQEPDTKALQEHNRIMKEEFKYKPVNNSK